MQRRHLIKAIAVTLIGISAGAVIEEQNALDTRYTPWDALLKKHVHWLRKGVQRQEYPDLKSIKDLGSFIQSAWKKKFFKLLGEERHLDWIEHEQLRPSYAEPRIHAAVNCASIGCPALRDEAFTAAKLDTQLEDGMRRFMADRTRNRVANGQLEVSSIFKWFKEDFEKGHLGLTKVEDVFARYATQLTSNPAEQAKLKDRSLRVTHLDYDWALNDVAR